MDKTDPPIQVEHPPHQKGIKKTAFFLGRFLAKTLLFILIFSLSFYFSESFNDSPYSQLQRRQKAIEEITAVLEKQGTEIKNVKLEDLATVIYVEATRYNHDPKLILALIAIESSFKNSSVSERGAIGLMQLMPYVGRRDGTRAWDRVDGRTQSVRPYYQRETRRLLSQQAN